MTRQGKVYFFIGTILQLFFVLTGSLDALRLRALHGLFVLVGLFLCQKKYWGIPPAILSFGVFFLHYETLVLQGGHLRPWELAVALLGILLLFTAGRRREKSLSILSLLFLLYPFVGPGLPGPLAHGGFTLRRVLAHLFWSSQGIFGVGIGVSSTYILVFMIYGALLRATGFTRLIQDLALCLVGSRLGGPAKVSVLASALMGMINGSAVANVATTGTLTIPMMIRAGYRPEFAAAVEAVASTGGQFCPPIMGAVGFVMAEFMGVSYKKVMLAALFPALFYYGSLLLSVHWEAEKRGLSPMAQNSAPLRGRLHLLLSLPVLILAMLLGFTPLFSAFLSMAVLILSANLSKNTRVPIASLVDAVVEGAVTMLPVALSCMLLGILIGVGSLTSLGLSLGESLIDLFGVAHPFVLGILAMVIALILGMGIPGVAGYVIVSSVIVPVFRAGGIDPMAAHFFALMTSCLSNITPPVALSSYMAASLAQAGVGKTGLWGMRLGMVGFLLPLFFLFNPILLTHEASASLLMAVLLSTALGVGILTLAQAGHWHGKDFTMPFRLLLGFSGILLMNPGRMEHMLALVLLIALYFGRKRCVKSA